MWDTFDIDMMEAAGIALQAIVIAFTMFSVVMAVYVMVVP